MKLLSQLASSSCCERNWSTYSFIHGVKRNALTPERVEDLVFVHINLRHLSRRTDAYKAGETRMRDVGGGSFDSLGGIGILEVADLSPLISSPWWAWIASCVFWFGWSAAWCCGWEWNKWGNRNLMWAWIASLDAFYYFPIFETTIFENLRVETWDLLFCNNRT